jgi:hypothetical protein
MPGAAPDHNVRPILTAQARCVNPNHGLHTHSQATRSLYASTRPGQSTQPQHRQGPYVRENDGMYSRLK